MKSSPSLSRRAAEDGGAWSRKVRRAETKMVFGHRCLQRSRLKLLQRGTCVNTTKTLDATCGCEGVSGHKKVRSKPTPSLVSWPVFSSSSLATARALRRPLTRSTVSSWTARGAPGGLAETAGADEDGASAPSSDLTGSKLGVDGASATVWSVSEAATPAGTASSVSVEPGFSPSFSVAGAASAASHSWGAPTDCSGASGGSACGSGHFSSSIQRFRCENILVRTLIRKARPLQRLLQSDCAASYAQRAARRRARAGMSVPTL